MTMEQAVEDLTEKMKKTDEKLDNLAVQVGSIESEFFSEGADVEVHNLLRTVSEVKSNYQHLRKEIVEVQCLQRQLSSSLQLQLKLMQQKYNTLKERIGAASPALDDPPQN